MASAFCLTGKMGLFRHLTAGEIAGQVRVLADALHMRDKKFNIVLMGMGEPLANFANLVRAIRIINAPWGLGIGARHITVSTSGLAPQIRQLAEESLQVHLAVSLHGATDPVRSRIMPVNRQYDLAALLAACSG